ncbi:MAG: NADPH:quinone oxidoreductase family protein [Gammaproteobacteria bacterium]|nr:NADPH:quinone oxidoreductase family protein [Gammaproteobacteria bacterium]
MKGVLVEDWKPFEQLTLGEVPEPEIGERQIRIQTRAAGISFATSLVVQGKYQRKPPLPFVPGTEVAGVVSEVGPGVKRFAVGDRVCAVIDWGGLAEQARAFEVNTFALPDRLDFTPAITFTNSYATSAAALTWRHLLDVQRGDWLLVHGAAGGVGIAAVEIGKILGATVIATAGSPSKLEVAREHGADHTIDYRQQDFREAVLALTDGRGVDKVYDPVGGEVFMQSLRCMAPEGRIMPVGFAGGQIQQIPANLLLVKNLTVCGVNMGYYIGWSPNDVRYEYEDRIRALMGQLFEWFEAGLIKPRIGATYPLAQFQKAMADVLERRAIGRIAITMG